MGTQKEMVMITVAYPAEDLWSSVFGCAWETWDWWREVVYLDGADWDKPGRVMLVIDDPDDDDATITKEIGVEDLVKAWNMTVQTSCTIGTAQSLDIEDLDASDGDCVLQTAMLGKVVFR